MFGDEMCSLIEFSSRTECHVSRKSLCFQFDDKSITSTHSRSILCW